MSTMARIGTVAQLSAELHLELARMRRLMEQLQAEREMLQTVAEVAKENAKKASKRLVSSHASQDA
jgi:hypothetical protein